MLKKVIKVFLTILGLCVVLLLSGCQVIRSIVSDFQQSAYHETTDLADYGTYIGNYNNEFPTDFINSFFPAAIGDNFTNVVYSYRAHKFDTFAFEAYLEFTIEDIEEFKTHVRYAIDGYKTEPFRYDPSYSACYIADYLSLDEEIFTNDSGQSYYYIEGARIGEILFSIDEQRIIYVAIGLYDGGGTSTDYLCKFFSRFGIDPKEYEEHTEEWNLEWDPNEFSSS